MNGDAEEFQGLHEVDAHQAWSNEDARLWQAGMPLMMKNAFADMEEEAAEPMRVPSSTASLLASMASLGHVPGAAAGASGEALAALQRGGMPGMQPPNMLGGTAIPPPEWANTTTVMMRNLPNKYTQRMLLTEINHTGFLGTFDFLYLPIDPETNANRGYAFLNFIEPGFAWMFKMSYEGRKMNRFNSNKVVSVVPATLQGFEANYAHYAAARVNRGDPAARPLFLREPKQPLPMLGGGRGGEARGEGRGGGGRGAAGRRRGGGAGGGGGTGGGTGGGGGNFDAYDQHLGMEVPAAMPQPSWAAGPGGPGGMGTYLGLEGGGTGSGAAPPYPCGNGEPKLPAGRGSAGCSGGSRGGGGMVPQFCPSCGGKIQPQFQFCPHCGGSLEFAMGGNYYTDDDGM